MKLTGAIKNLKNPSGMILLGAVVAPSMVVGLIRFVGDGASRASAGSVDPVAMAMPNGPEPFEAAPNIAAAMAYAQGLVGQPLSGSVLGRKEMIAVEPEPTRAAGQQPKPVPAPKATIELPTVRLTAVLGTGRRAIAVVEGSTLRVGDEVAPGWRIVAVNARAQSLRLRSIDGQVATITMKDN